MWKKLATRKRRLIGSPLLYAEWCVSLLLAGMALAANFLDILQGFGRSIEITTLSLGLIGFGTMNVALVHTVGAYKVRYRRAQRAYAIIHEVAEEARNLRGDHGNLDKCRRAINAICFVHLEKLLQDFLGFSPPVTLKYVLNGNLIAVRSKEQQGRPRLPEAVQDNEIYEKMLRHPDKFKAVYVRDVRDKEELAKTFGVDCDKLRQRAEGKYRTFLTLPIRLSHYSDGQLPAKTQIGMLGIDFSRPNAFEELEPEDYQAVYAIVDILSECVLYFVTCQGAQA